MATAQEFIDSATAGFAAIGEQMAENKTEQDALIAQSDAKADLATTTAEGAVTTANTAKATADASAATVNATVAAATAQATIATTKAAEATSAAAAALLTQAAVDLLEDDITARLTMAQLVMLAGTYFPDARSYLPKGVNTTVGAITPGSAYTNGTFALSWTGGNFQVNPTGTFTVAGGVVTEVTITGRGRCVQAAPSIPTPVFTASAGGTGAGVALTLGDLVQAGAIYWTDHATDASLMIAYTNNAGAAAAATGGATLPKVHRSQVVPCTLAMSNANLFTMTPATGYSVSGQDQAFMGLWGGSNTGPVQATIPGIGTKSIVMPNEQPIPPRYTVANRPFMIRYVAAKDKLFLVTDVNPVAGFVACKQHSAYTTALHVKVQAAHGGIRWDWTFENQTFEFIAKYDKPFGSAQFTLYDSDGTTILINGTSLTEPDAVTPPPAFAWRAGDVVRCRRDAATGRVFILRETDRTATTLSRLSHTTGPTGMIPSLDRPVLLTRVDETTWYVDVRPHDDHYIGKRRFKGADFIRHVIKDMGPFQQDVFAPALNSVFACFGGHIRPLLNCVFNDIVSGITVTNGAVPTTLEPVITSAGVGQPTSNMGQAGLGHNHIDIDAWALTITVNDPSTSNVDVVVSDLRTMPIGTVYGCDKVTSTLTGWTLPKNDTGRTSRFTYKWTFASDPKGCARIETTYDPTHPSCTLPMAVCGAFMPFMVASRYANKARGYLNGMPVVSGIRDIGADGDVSIGFIDELAMWAEEDPCIVMWAENVVGGGAKSHYENGVAIDIEGSTYIDGTTQHDKAYCSPAFNDYTVNNGLARDMHDIVIGADSYIRITNQTPITT